MTLVGLGALSFFPLLTKLSSVLGVIVGVSRLLLRVGFVMTSYWDGDG